MVRSLYSTLQFLVVWGRLGLKVYRVLRAIRAQMALLVPRVLRVLKAQKALLD
jgi:hypothetical protein